MDNIDPTPRPASYPIRPQVMEDIDATPRRIPGSRQVKPAPMEDIDATPRRPPQPANVETRPASTTEPPPQRILIPPIVGPGRVNKVFPPSILPELETLMSLLPLENKVTSHPLVPDGPGKATEQITEPQPHLENRSANTQGKPAQKASRSQSTKITRIIRKRSLVPTKVRQKRRRRRWLLWMLVSVLLLMLLIGGGISYSLYLVETHILSPLAQFFHPVSGGNEEAIEGKAWNLLLLGSDNDHKFAYPDVLTQVMMVVRINPYAHKVSMVSIPRDSWVRVPGQEGMHKIDQAFYLGAAPHHRFDDGVRLARATIEQDYGIPIDRYAWIGLEGFASVINTLGGIDLDLQHPLLDDNYPDDTSQGKNSLTPYAIKRIYLPPGPQHLSGDQALEYVRSRHADLVGDIGRTQRQQEILQALKQKLNMTTIFNHLEELFHDLTGKVYTDLRQGELLSLGSFVRDLPSQAVTRITLGPGHGEQNYGTLTRLMDPNLREIQDVVLPNCANIQPVLNALFDLGDVQSCQVTAT